MNGYISTCQVVFSNLAGFALLHSMIENTDTPSMFVIYGMVVIAWSIIGAISQPSNMLDMMVLSILPHLAVATLVAVPSFMLFISAGLSTVVIGFLVIIAGLRTIRAILNK